MVCPFGQSATSAQLSAPGSRQRALQDSKCADSKCADSKCADVVGPARVCELARAAHPAATPAAPLEAVELALQVTRKKLQEVVGIVSATTGGRLQGRRGGRSR